MRYWKKMRQSLLLMVVFTGVSLVVGGYVVSSSYRPANIEAWFFQSTATPYPNPSTYYVSPNGSDSNPGTLEKPWKMLNSASEHLNPGDTLILRDGTYHEQWTPRSGTYMQSITYAAYKGEKPIIDGENRIKRNIELINKRYIIFDGITVMQPS